MTTPHGQFPPPQQPWQQQGPWQQLGPWQQQGSPPQPMPPQRFPQQPPRKKTGNGLAVVGGVIGGVILIGVLANMGDGSTQTATPAAATPTTTTTTRPAAPTTRAATPEPAATTEAPKGSVSQRQAIRKAESYLSYTAFSQKGLIKQLEFEKFATEDATYAVDNITVDWNEQAAKKAKSYLDYTSFSRQGLIKQLKFEGFTSSQAEHGVNAVGL